MVNSTRGTLRVSKKRGISTIVGGMIFLVLLSAGFSTFFLSMDIQQDAVKAQKTLSNSLMKKSQEEFDIAVSTDQDNDNRLGIQVKNLGSNPVEVANIWIINQSGNFEANKHEIVYSDAFIPPGYGANILENKALHMAPDEYEIKVISTLGTIEKSKIEVGGNNNLRAELFAIPPDVRINENVTITMYVENIGISKLLGVTPETPTISPALTSTLPPDPPPVDLESGESIFFTWQYEVTGPTPGVDVKFSSRANAVEEGTSWNVSSNLASDTITAREPSTTEIIVLTQDLLSRPEIFMIIPSPFGIDNQEGLWGVNIANPTPNPFEVNKVTISTIVPRSQSQDRIFDTNKCTPNTVPPTPSNWECPSDNQLMWKNTANPVTVPPYSVYPFLVKMDPGSLGGSTDDLEAVLVQATVYTTLGEFGKSGYGSSVKNAGSYANVAVYLSKVEGSTSSNDIISNVTSVKSGSKVLLNATLADFDISSTNYIDDGAQLIINVPKGWTVDPSSIDTFGDFTCAAPCPEVFSDTSSQIIGILNSDLDGTGDIARSIQFEITAPVVTNEQMYVMYILAEGTTNEDDYAIGPLAEVVLQVVP